MIVDYSKRKPIEEINSDSGLKILVYNYGEVDSVMTSEGKILYVDYTGYLEDGTIFSSSEKNGDHFAFKLGKGMVIPAWDEGFKDRWAGAEMTFIVPPELAYKDEGSRDGSIPPNSIIMFDVKIKGVEQ